MMTPEQRADYEKAAMVLEASACPKLPIDVPWKEVHWKAWHRCNDAAPTMATVRMVDRDAASLLRECLQKGEVLR